jgi:hypothetical protein
VPPHDAATIGGTPHTEADSRSAIKKSGGKHEGQKSGKTAEADKERWKLQRSIGCRQPQRRRHQQNNRKSRSQYFSLRSESSTRAEKKSGREACAILLFICFLLGYLCYQKKKSTDPNVAHESRFLR